MVEKRSEYVMIRLKPSELESIKKAAEKLRITSTEVIRTAALNRAKRINK